MIEQLVEAIEQGISFVMSKVKLDLNDYCDLETTSGGNLVAKDGSIGTVLRYNGYRTLLGKEDFKELAREFTALCDIYFGRRGHRMQIVLMRDNDPSEEIRRILTPMYETAESLELDLTDLLDEKVQVHAHHCMEEHVYFVLWTTPAVLSREELKLTQAENMAFRKEYQIPGMKHAQNVLRPLRFLEDRHNTFIAKVVDELSRLNCAMEPIEVGSAICEQSRFLYRSRPNSWRPTLIGDDVIARWKNNRKARDISELMFPRLEDQIFLAPAVAGGAKKGELAQAGLTDTRAARISDRIFAPVGVKIPPSKPAAFAQFFRAINQQGVEETINGKRVNRRVPYAISFLIEGDGLKSIDLKATMSSILAFASAGNRNLNAATNLLRRYRDDEHASIVKMQIMALTWAKHTDPDVLTLRRAKLSAALQGWGNITVEEEFGEPIEPIMSVVPGLMTSSPATTSAPPLHTAAYLLPLSRPASPFPQGTTLFRTLDGKLLPYEFFSALQSTWISLYFGGPGAGKSVLANRLNKEMCLMGGLKRLPYICVIDIGVSSSGFIKIIQDAAPEHLKHLAIYRRLQNTRDYAMNQADTHLGLRMPLPRDRELLKNFLLLCATPPERGFAHTFMPELVSEIIRMAYVQCSDTEERGNPKKFNLHVNAIIAGAVRQHGIEFSEATTWWEVVDELFDRGLFYLAAVAQRYAVPTMSDFLRVGSSTEVAGQFQNYADCIEEFKLMISNLEYEIFKGETQFDVGESRVMALDLQDVVTSGSASARKQATVMYMAAMNAFTRKFSVIKEDLDLIPPKYRGYHARRVEENAEEYKRLFIDEYHKTGPQGAKAGEKEKFASYLRESVLVYGRESRKWMLEIALASQLPDDFEDLAKLATSVFILDQGNEATRRRIREIFSLSETEEAALRQFVKGAQPGVGSTFLAKIKTKDGDLSQLMTATSGGLELWALSTTGEDRALRTRLYEEMPSRDARRLLKRRFPSGTCKNYVLAERNKARIENTEGFLDEELAKSIIQQLTAELVAEWKLESDAVAVPA